MPRHILLFISLIMLLFSHSALASPDQDIFRPAVLYDMGTKFDKSYNESVYRGFERFKKETGVTFWEFQPTSEAQREQYLRQISQKGVDIVVVIGFANIPVLEKVAPDFPDVKYVMIDATVEMPNVQAVSYKEHEGSYLVGALAALKSKTKHIGFIGGMDVPLVRRFSCAYEQGAKAIDPKITLTTNMVGDTPDAWRDPTKAGEITKSQIERHADVIFTASGVSAHGVFSAVAEYQNVYAIGADSNQNYMQPQKILTSMVKNMDHFVYESLKQAQSGEWKAGKHVLGLRENGVEWAYDEHNKPLITKSEKNAIEQLRNEIIDGKIQVIDYMEGNSCQITADNH